MQIFRQILKALNNMYSLYFAYIVQSSKQDEQIFSINNGVLWHIKNQFHWDLLPSRSLKAEMANWQPMILILHVTTVQ